MLGLALKDDLDLVVLGDRVQILVHLVEIKLVGFALYVLLLHLVNGLLAEFLEIVMPCTRVLIRLLINNLLTVIAFDYHVQQVYHRVLHSLDVIADRALGIVVQHHAAARAATEPRRVVVLVIRQLRGRPHGTGVFQSGIGPAAVWIQARFVLGKLLHEAHIVQLFFYLGDLSFAMEELQFEVLSVAGLVHTFVQKLPLDYVHWFKHRFYEVLEEVLMVHIEKGLRIFGIF